MKTKLKLFVWTGFSPDHTGGLAFAIAEDETTAKEMIEDSRGYGVTEWGELHIHQIRRHICYSCCGGG
jgi:hypothetical protein